MLATVSFGEKGDESLDVLVFSPQSVYFTMTCGFRVRQSANIPLVLSVYVSPLPSSAQVLLARGIPRSKLGKRIWSFEFSVTHKSGLAIGDYVPHTHFSLSRALQTRVFCILGPCYSILESRSWPLSPSRFYPFFAF